MLASSLFKGKIAFLSTQFCKKVCHIFFGILKEFVIRGTQVKIGTCKYTTEFSLNVSGKTDASLIIHSNIQALIVDTSFHYSGAATRRVLWKKVFLKILQNSLASWFNWLEAFNVIEKETLAQVFPSEFCENFKNIYFEEHVGTAASGYLELLSKTHKVGSF